MKISTSFFHLYLLLSCFIISPFSHFNSFTFPSETIFHLLRYIPLFLSFILFYFFFRGVSLFPTFCFIVEIRDQPLPSLFALFAADGIRKTKTTFRKSDKDNENIMKQVSSMKGLCETVLVWENDENTEAGFQGQWPCKTLHKVLVP